jgi:O-antigen/teichoic acid export membrane protein
MSMRSLILKGAIKLGASQATAQLCSFLRNIILARLISPEDFGIAATLAITFSLFEMLSNLSSEILLVQAKEGEEPKLQQTAQLLRAGRGTLNAVFIFLLAGPVAALFSAPETAWAFRCLALVPLIRGFTHLDIHRFQRNMNFGPLVISNVVTNVLLVLLAWPLAVHFRDYSAMLWLLVAQALFSTIGSHIVAQRRYAWTWNYSYARQIASFGWPLLINGSLMFIIFDGDRFVIGSAQRIFSQSVFTLADLGVYSVAFALTMAPTMLVANISSNLFLPVLSQVQTVREEFQRRYEICTQAITLASLSTAVGFIIAGGTLIVLIYGNRYFAAGSFVGILGVMFGLRSLRVAPTVAAIALGDTRNAMVSNIARSVALPGILFCAWAGYGLPAIALCGLVGETLALAVCVWRLQAQHGLPAVISWRGLSVYSFGAVVASVVAWGGLSSRDWASAFVVTAAVILIAGALALAYFGDLRHAILRASEPLSGIASRPEGS